MRWFKPRRAFSIAEILVGVGMLATILMVAAGMLPLSRLMDARSEATAVATDLATKEMDTLRETAFNASPFNALPASLSSTVTQSGVTYTVQTTLTAASSTTPTTLVDVSVVVTWTDDNAHGSSLQHTVRLDTIMTQIGALP